MKKQSTRWGFTLIELLVVVLIIGLLAAVALPQYQKAVKKAQSREVYVALEALDKAYSEHYLNDGKSSVYYDRLSIKLPELKYFKYAYPNPVYNGSTLETTSSTEPSPSYLEYANGGKPILTKQPEGVNIHVRIENGHITTAWCRGDNNTAAPKLCSLYFDCPPLQATSAEQVNYKCQIL